MKFNEGQLLNPIRESVMIFPIETDCTFIEGELVVVNSKTYMATHPKNESGYVAIGRAIETVTNVCGTPMIICKDGIFVCKNSEDPLYKLSKSDIRKMCYFEAENTVTTNNINTTKAGIVLEVLEDRVIVEITPNRRK